MVNDPLSEPDRLRGIHIAGGGISGVLEALRDLSATQRDEVRVDCRAPVLETRTGLTERPITAALSHPPEQPSARLIETTISAIDRAGSGSSAQCRVCFGTITPESV
jgi:LacI family transcriptional regulator, galactose operon repressor